MCSAAAAGAGPRAASPAAGAQLCRGPQQQTTPQLLLICTSFSCHGFLHTAKMLILLTQSISTFLIFLSNSIIIAQKTRKILS